MSIRPLVEGRVPRSTCCWGWPRTSQRSSGSPWSWGASIEDQRAPWHKSYGDGYVTICVYIHICNMYITYMIYMYSRAGSLLACVDSWSEQILLILVGSALCHHVQLFFRYGHHCWATTEVRCFPPTRSFGARKCAVKRCASCLCQTLITFSSVSSLGACCIFKVSLERSLKLWAEKGYNGNLAKLGLV